MTPGDAARPPFLDTDSQATEVLRWCAASAPELWFPSSESRTHNVPRESLDAPLARLRQAGLIRIADWVRGRGQGYAITAEGVRSLEPPAEVAPETLVEQVIETPYDRGELTREAFLAPRPAAVVPALLLLLTGGFVATFIVAWRMDAPLDSFLRTVEARVLSRVGAVTGPDLLRGEWWRLGTAGFVHVGLLHLVGNLFALALLGPVAEGLWGRWRFALLFLLTGLAATCTAAALNPTVLVAGATGSIWGVQIAVITWLIRYREHLPASSIAEWTRRLIMVLGVNVVISLTPGVCWESHVAGAVAGIVAALLLDWTRPGSRLRRKLLGYAGLALLAAGSFGGLLAVVHYHESWRPLREVRAGKAASGDESPRSTGLSPDRVNDLHRRAAVALIARGASNRTGVEELNALLAADAVKVLARAPAGSPAAAYLGEVLRYTQLLQTSLAADRLPTPTESQALADQRLRIERMFAGGPP